MIKSPISLSIFSLALIILYTVETNNVYLVFGLLLGLLAAAIEIKNLLSDSESNI